MLDNDADVPRYAVAEVVCASDSAIAAGLARKLQLGDADHFEL